MNELWLALPKGGKTLGGSDEAFLRESGFEIGQRLPRIDDYRLIDDPPEGAPETNIRVFELKPGDAVENIADGLLDAAVVGIDVLKEFNFSSRGQKGRTNAVEIVYLDLAPCALAVAVPENGGLNSISDLNGKTIVTKYPASVENWARKNKIAFQRIVKRNGGIESYNLLMPGTLVADMVESGASLAANGWRLLGMEDSAWRDIRDGSRKFCDLSIDAMQAIPGVVVASRAVLVRPARRMNADQERMLETLSRAFFFAAQRLGRDPQMRDKRVAQQRSYPTGRAVTPIGQSRGEMGHGFRHWGNNGFSRRI